MPLVLTAQPEGAIPSPAPAAELITEGDTVEEALAHVQDALAAVVELYKDLASRSPCPVVKDSRRGEMDAQQQQTLWTIAIEHDEVADSAPNEDGTT